MPERLTGSEDCRQRARSLFCSSAWSASRRSSVRKKNIRRKMLVVLFIKLRQRWACRKRQQEIVERFVFSAIGSSAGCTGRLAFYVERPTHRRAAARTGDKIACSSYTPGVEDGPSATEPRSPNAQYLRAHRGNVQAQSHSTCRQWCGPAAVGYSVAGMTNHYRLSDSVTNGRGQQRTD